MRVSRHEMNRAIVVASLLGLVSAAQADTSCSDAYWSATNPASAADCRRLAETGDPESEFGYGLLLWSGHDRVNQPKEAVVWLRRAAMHGHVLARVSLGRFLTDPEAPSEVRDLPEGYAWWVVGGESDAASKLRSRLNASELATGEHLAIEFALKYGRSR